MEGDISGVLAGRCALPTQRRLISPAGAERSADQGAHEENGSRPARHWPTHFPAYSRVVARGYSVHVPARNTDNVADISLLVRTPGNLTGYRAFTDEQRAEAEAYARSQGVEVEQLP